MARVHALRLRRRAARGAGRPVTARGAWWAGVVASLPIALGYLPVALAFGAAARAAGLDSGDAALISATVFAGASQFALVGLLGAGGPPAVAVLAALALNVRHVLYGPVLAPWLRGCSRAWRALLAFGLTDEVFAAAAARLPQVPEADRPRWTLGLVTGAYASWVGGTWLGAAGGSLLLASLPGVGEALAFALPVLFLVLLLPMLTEPPAAVAAAASALVALAAHRSGPAGLGLAAGAALGVLAGRAWERYAAARRGREEAR